MNLQKAAGLLFSKSLRFYQWSLACIGALYVLTVLTFILRDAWTDAVLLIAILALQVGQTLIKYRAVTWYGRGEQARRMDQLEEALGTVPNALSVQRIRTFVGLCEDEKVSGYWFTQAPKGARRLVEMIEESSFYTTTYAEACWSYFRTFAITGSILCIVFLTIAVRIGLNAGKEEFWSHVVVAIEHVDG